MPLNVVFCCGPPRVVDTTYKLKGHELLKQWDAKQSDGSGFYILCNGRKVDENSVLDDEKTYHIVPRVLGGKGGFGSMLRAIGAQIEKTTSREACRDLSGRRMRDINNEKKLKEWLAKEAEREKEKEERRQERLARHLNRGQHKFDDPEYHEQRAKVQEDLQDALHTGLKRAHKKGESSSSGPAKKSKVSKSSKEWLGMDIDSDDLDSESDTEARPGSPSLDNGASTSKVAPVEVKSEPGENSSAASRVSSSTSEHGDPASLQQSPVLGSDHIAGSSDSNSPPPVAEVKTEPDGGDGGSEDKPHPHSLLSQLPPPSSSPNVADRKPGDLALPATVADPAETVDPNTPVDLELYASEKELAALGLEHLKCALMSRGIKCGGTLEERAARLFSVRGLSTEEIDPWLFAKSKGKGKKSK